MPDTASPRRKGRPQALAFLREHEWRKVFGARLSESLKAHNIRPKELAHMIGVAECTVSLYRSGKRSPTAVSIARMANYLGVNFKWLALGEGPRDA